jgi:hypothetical protein
MDPKRTVALAERVASIARTLRIETALIGAYALAVHHHVRGSLDIDLAAVVDFDALHELQRALEDAGLSTKLHLPDEQDPLGGKLVIWDRVDEDGEPLEPAEIVNFLNPFAPRRSPAAQAIRNAVNVAETSALRCPRLEHLVALKLDAGGPQDLADVIELLRANPDADRELIRATCKEYGLDVIDRLLA